MPASRFVLNVSRRHFLDRHIPARPKTIARLVLRMASTDTLHGTYTSTSSALTLLQ